MNPKTFLIYNNNNNNNKLIYRLFSYFNSKLIAIKIINIYYSWNVSLLENEIEKKAYENSNRVKNNKKIIIIITGGIFQ